MKTGDAIHSIAQPIAIGIDAIWGSDLAGCSGCAQRRDMLNEGHYLEAFRTLFKQPEGEKMQFQIQIVVEAESVEQALQKKSEGTVISVTPRPQQPTARPMNAPQGNMGMPKVG